MKRLAILLFAVTSLAGIVWLVRGRPPAPPDENLGAVNNSEFLATHDVDPIVEVPPTLTASDTHPLPDLLVDPRLTVEKGRRSLTVHSAGERVKTYRIALGSAPVGDKEIEGDGRTPEGEFYVCTKNPQSRHGRSLGLSYPSYEDAERGRAEGLISTREHRHIIEALDHFRRPPWNTALGGEIMIHGGGTETDWTAGCIAMAPAEAEELFDRIPPGTPVEILP